MILLSIMLPYYLAYWHTYVHFLRACVRTSKRAIMELGAVECVSEESDTDHVIEWATSKRALLTAWWNSWIKSVDPSLRRVAALISVISHEIWKRFCNQPDGLHLPVLDCWSDLKIDGEPDLHIIYSHNQWYYCSGGKRGVICWLEGLPGLKYHRWKPKVYAVYPFLVAWTRLYTLLCWSVGRSVGR